jgi:putative tricarboxylic transport membrane protein
MSIGLKRVAAVWACTTWALCAQAATPQWSPERNVEVIVPSGPGGGTDRTARTVQGLLDSVGLVPKSNVVNKPGAGGSLGYFYLSQQTGGHHVSVTTVAVLTNHITGRSKVSHTDLTPLAQLFSEYLLFAVRTDSPYKSGAEILERMKRDPQSVSIGITVVGGTSQMAMGSILRKAGGEPRNMKTVVFKSGGEVTTALLGGHVDLVPAPVANLLPHVTSGKLRAVAVSAPRRLPRELAEVPTWHELGANTDFDTWRGMIGPKAMTPAQIAFWDQAFSRMVEDGGWKKDLERNHWADNYLQSRAASRYLDDQYKDFRAILTDLGLVK